jgi:hypothetical protein
VEGDVGLQVHGRVLVAYQANFAAPEQFRKMLCSARYVL